MELSGCEQQRDKQKITVETLETKLELKQAKICSIGQSKGLIFMGNLWCAPPPEVSKHCYFEEGCMLL